MLKVGLTGGLGCGKSTAIKFFKKQGVSIVDADVIAKSLVQPGQPALAEIARSLGKRFIQADGQLNRGLLKKEAFSDTHLLNRLESILHPLIRDAIQSEISDIDAEAGVSMKCNYLIVDVPLLVEKKYQDLFDEIVVVECTAEQQLERVKSRDNINEDTIHSIIREQATNKDRLAIATETLDNKNSIELLEEQVKALHAKFTALS